MLVDEIWRRNVRCVTRVESIQRAATKPAARAMKAPPAATAVGRTPTLCDVVAFGAPLEAAVPLIWPFEAADPLIWPFEAPVAMICPLEITGDAVGLAMDHAELPVIDGVKYREAAVLFPIGSVMAVIEKVVVAD